MNHFSASHILEELLDLLAQILSGTYPQLIALLGILHESMLHIPDDNYTISVSPNKGQVQQKVKLNVKS